jgi:hypothetical protein
MDAVILQILRIAFQTISDRVLTILSLCMTFVLACWVMRDPTQERIIMAAFFGTVVFVPSLIKEKKREGQQQQTPQD